MKRIIIWLSVQMALMAFRFQRWMGKPPIFPLDLGSCVSVRGETEMVVVSISLDMDRGGMRARIETVGEVNP